MLEILKSRPWLPRGFLLDRFDDRLVLILGLVRRLNCIGVHISGNPILVGQLGQQRITPVFIGNAQDTRGRVLCLGKSLGEGKYVLTQSDSLEHVFLVVCKRVLVLFLGEEFLD